MDNPSNVRSYLKQARSMPRLDTLPIDYQITRPFPWRYVGLVFYLAIFLFTIFMTIVNVALVGYETVTEFSPNFNQADHHWYHKFVPSYKPTQFCDPIIYGSGDALKTNFSIFDWKIVSMVNSVDNTSVPTRLEYRGEALDWCAMGSVQTHAQFTQPWKISSTITAICKLANGINIYLQAAGAETTGNPFEIAGFASSSFVVSPAIRIQLVLSYTHFDVLAALHRQNTTAPVAPRDSDIWVKLNFPLRARAGYVASCLNPVVNEDSFTMSGNWFSTEEPDNSTQALLAPLFQDLAQTVFAAVRLDFGDNMQNNIFLDTTIANNTLRTPDVQATYWGQVKTDGGGQKSAFPISSDFGASRVQTSFACQYQKLKAPGSLLASVFAATWSIAMSVWAGAILAGTQWVKRNPAMNVCNHSCSQDAKRTDTPDSRTKGP